MKLLLLFMLPATAASLAFAQAPSGASDEGQISYEKRLIHLRADLKSSLSAQPLAGQNQPVPVPRQLSPQERAELRQQLRQQYKPISQQPAQKRARP